MTNTLTPTLMPMILLDDSGVEPAAAIVGELSDIQVGTGGSVVGPDISCPQRMSVNTTSGHPDIDEPFPAEVVEGAVTVEVAVTVTVAVERSGVGALGCCTLRAPGMAEDEGPARGGMVVGGQRDKRYHLENLP